MTFAPYGIRFVPVSCCQTLSDMDTAKQMSDLVRKDVGESINQPVPLLLADYVEVRVLAGRPESIDRRRPFGPYEAQTLDLRKDGPSSALGLRIHNEDTAGPSRLFSPQSVSEMGPVGFEPTTKGL